MQTRVCAHVPCSQGFEPTAPAQKYHTVACREAAEADRAEDRKAERALRRASSAQFKQHLPSSFFDGSRLKAAVADIRFEMEQDKGARSGRAEVVAARIRAVREAQVADDPNVLYGTLIAAAAALGSWATRISGGTRWRQERHAPA